MNLLFSFLCHFEAVIMPFTGFDPRSYLMCYLLNVFNGSREVYMFRAHYCRPNFACFFIKWRRVRWAGPVARMDGMWNGYRHLSGKTERKRLLGRTACRWEDNIKEISPESVDFIHMTHKIESRWLLWI